MGNKLKDLQGRMKALVKEMEELRALETLTDEQEERADQMIAEINEIGPEIRKLAFAEREISSFEDLRQSRGAVGAMTVPNEAREGGNQVETRSLGEQFVETDFYKNLVKRGGEGSGQVALAPPSRRALVTTTTLPDGYLEPHRIPGIDRMGPKQGSLRDVLNVGSTDKDAIMYFQEASFTNNAAIVGEATATDGTSGLKPESDFALEAKTSEMVLIAHWVAVTKQTLWSAPEMMSYINGLLLEGLDLVEDTELLTGDGTSGHMTGLLNTTGVQALNAAYFTATPVKGAGTDRENFNRLLHATTQIGINARARANFIAVGPAAYEAAMTAADGEGQYYGTGPFSTGLVPTIWGRRVVLNENMPANKALVGDGRYAMIWDRLQAMLEIGVVDKQFIRNMRTLLAEKSVGLTVFRPAAFAVVDLVS